MLGWREATFSALPQGRHFRFPGNGVDFTHLAFRGAASDSHDVHLTDTWWLCSDENAVGKRRETMSKVSYLEQRHATGIFREEEANGSHFSVWFVLVII